MKKILLSTSSLTLLLLGAACSGANSNTSVNTADSPSTAATTNSTAPSSTTTNTVVQPAAATVTTSRNGFTPSTLTIKKGATVTFMNEDTRQWQPASDPHPDHTDYPEFEMDDIAPGQSASFTFTRLGTFEYHNHNNETIQGTITITE